METAKKGGRVPVNGKRKVSAHMTNGILISAETQSKWSKDPVWAAGFYNFHTQKWEPDTGSGPLNYRQAYARASYLSGKEPYAKLGIVLVPGFIRKMQNAAAKAAKAEATVDA